MRLLPIVASKKKHELAICKEFIKCENVVPPCQSKYTIKTHGDAPDFTLLDDKGNQLSLEITSAFTKHGKAILEGLQNTKAHSITIGPFLIEDPDGMLISSCQDRLNEKCKNDYGYPCILIIRLCTYVDDETIRRIHEIKIPRSNKYSEIYVAFNAPASSPNAGKFIFYKIHSPATDSIEWTQTYEVCSNHL